MKKFLKITLTILCIIIVKLLFTFTTNEIIIANYNKERYNESLIKSLYFINFSESYIAYYNHGNILYKNGNYDEAISKYETSLEKNPPQERICDIRINLSLSIIAKIDASDKKDTLSKLKKARNILYEDNCAHEEDDKGDSEKAEQLEEEIKNYEEEINNSEEENNNNNEENREENNPQKEQSVEEQLKEIQKESNASRQKENDTNENRLTYYDGKSW